MKSIFHSMFSDIEKYRTLYQSKDLIESGSSSSIRPPVFGTPRSGIINRSSLFKMNKNTIIERPTTISLDNKSRLETNLLKGKSPMIESGLAQSIIDQSKREEESFYNEFLSKIKKHIEPEFIAISYRSPPGHGNFINQSFWLTKMMRQKIKDFSDNLVLIKRNYTPSAIELILFNSRKHDFRTTYDSTNNKVWVEVLTSYKGMSGKFIVMAILGAGCIVWYSLLPMGPAELSPSINHLCTLDDGDIRNVLKKVLYIDKKGIKGDVQSAYENLYPFSQIIIPGPASVKQALGFGVMMAMILGMGFSADAPLTSILDTLGPSQVDSIQTSTEVSSSIHTAPCAEVSSSIHNAPSAEESSSIHTIPNTEVSSNAGGAGIANIIEL